MKTTAHLIAEAKARIENLSPAAVAAELEGGDVLLVDLREAESVPARSIPGAIHAPRGMLEFSADPTSAYYRPASTPPAGPSSTAPRAAARRSPPTCCRFSATTGSPTSTGGSTPGEAGLTLEATT